MRSGSTSWCAAVQAFDAVHDDAAAAGAFDLRAHRDRGSRPGRRPPAPSPRSRARVVPSASVAAISTFSVPVTLTMSNTKRAPFRRFATRLDEAVLDADLGAQRLQALDVLVDRTRTDRATAGQRDFGLAVLAPAAARAPAPTRAWS